MIYEIKQGNIVSHLFEHWSETIILSCLQGVMGRIFANSEHKPKSAAAMLGDFCFLAGEPNIELVKYKPFDRKNDFIIMVPQNVAWAMLIEDCCNEKAKKVIRYATKKEKYTFDIKSLEAASNTLSNGFEMKIIDEDLYYKCRETKWCRDFVSQYQDYEMYRNYGLGVVILKDGEIVSGASSYSSYMGGIEIEVDTKEDYRRQGLAYCSSARLILECLKRGLYPSWDAQNLWSLSLAKKLGYHFDHEYTAYEVWGY